MTRTRVTAIALDGQVLVDSGAPAATLENHAARPEVLAALAGRLGEDRRVSSSTGEAFYYVALPLRRGGQIFGAVRLAVPLTQIDRALNQMMLGIAGLTLLVALLTAGLTLLVTRLLTVPLQELTRLVQRATTGHLTDRLPIRSNDELGLLAHSFNAMAGELDSVIRALSHQRDEMSAILDSVTDGVMIVDRQLRLRRINQAAVALFEPITGTANLPPAMLATAAQDRPLIEVVRDHELVTLVDQALRTDQPQRQVIERPLTAVAFSVLVTPIEAGSLTGALITLHDVTELRRLEQVRRQFVANVSHELRTPLANVKLMVETIQTNPDDQAMANTFLERINAEIDSLTQMVRELLELARLESGQIPLERRLQPLDQVVEEAVDRLRPQAERHGVLLAVAPALGRLPPVLFDRERLTGVMINLLHNAIKFTPPGGRIDVAGSLGADHLQIDVRDTGVGIAPDELPRLFERFYKVDKARSGGGTGLGLAIVKHTILAHGGRVWAESTPNHGSCFSFSLPLQSLQAGPLSTGGGLPAGQAAR